MSENITRVSLDVAGESLTDWFGLAALTEEEIEVAIASDSETFAPSDDELREAVWRVRTNELLRRGKLRRWSRPLRSSERRMIDRLYG